MTCIGITENVRRRFSAKDYFLWRDEQTGTILTQYFNHPEETYSHESKTFENYVIALGKTREEREEFFKIDYGLRALSEYFEFRKPMRRGKRS